MDEGLACHTSFLPHIYISFRGREHWDSCSELMFPYGMETGLEVIRSLDSRFADQRALAGDLVLQA